MQQELLIEQKVYKQRRKRAEWKSRRNLFLYSLPKEERLLYTANNFSNKGSIVSLNVPNEFSTSINIEAVLEFVAKCKTLALSRRHTLSFNFKKVEKVNSGALALLLTIVKDLTDLNIAIKGNLPRNAEAKQEFIDSGFLEYFYDRNGRRTACKNKILVQGKNKTEQERSAKEIEKAMQTVFGEPKFNPPIQGALIEMMANSVNHAFPDNTDDQAYFFEQFLQNKRWYLSVYHDLENKKVHFSFIDNGIGILKTIRRGIYRQIVDSLDNTQVLRNAFDGEYRSSTMQIERGRGLPTIKNAFEKKAIKDLKVVTNDYSYSFENQSGIKLANSFEGTVYFWTLDETCSYGISKN